MPKNIAEKLLFYTPVLESRKTLQGKPIEKITFLTVSALERTYRGQKTLIEGESFIETLYYLEDEDGAKFTEEEDSVISIPARGYCIIDWAEEVSPEDIPLASLTYIILHYDGGEKRKISEITMGKIEPATFKLLQVAAVNRLLNEDF